MQWKLIVLIFVVVCVTSMFIASKNSTETFEQERQASAASGSVKAEEYKAGAVAFDAYNEVHGRPPLSEALDHYRNIAATEKLTKDQMMARIQSDSTLKEDRPVAIKVSDDQVDAELERLKTHAVSVESMTAPVVSPVSPHVDSGISTRLRELSEQLAAIAQEVRPSAGPPALVRPVGVEQFFGA